jgi:hypothetical protein
LIQKNQHYPPGTQENYNSFASKNIIMEKGKELEFPEGPGGLESDSRILMNVGSLRGVRILMTLAKQKVP